MKIELDSNLYAKAYGILGRRGETQTREIVCSNPHIEDADMYKLRFVLPSGACYDVDITRGSISTPASLLAEEGIVWCQWLATSSVGAGNYTTLAKSNVFACLVTSAIDGNVQPLPTYEQSADMLDRLTDEISGLVQQVQTNTTGISTLGSTKASRSEIQGSYQIKTALLSKTAYDAMETHDTSTAYYVIDGDKVKLYLGDLELASGCGVEGEYMCVYSGAVVSDGGYYEKV